LRGGPENEKIDLEYNLTLFRKYCEYHFKQKVRMDCPPVFRLKAENTYSNLTDEISIYYIAALLLESNLVIYYAGHSIEDSGDWDINGTERIDLNGLHGTLQGVVRSEDFRGSRKEIYIIIDSCYSGHWPEKLRRNIKRQINRCKFTLVKEIVASCTSDVKTFGNYFSLAIWGNENSDIIAWTDSWQGHTMNVENKVEYNIFSDFLASLDFQSSDVFRELASKYEDYCWKIVLDHTPHYYNIEDTKKTLLACKSDFRELPWYFKIN